PEATAAFRQALGLRQQLYPKDKYPDGHPDLATSLNNLGLLLQAQGEYGQAEPYLRQALQMCQGHYPKASYPQGHPHLALSLNNLGALLDAQGQYGQAQKYFQDALAMHQRLVTAFADTAAEAPALNYRASLPSSRDNFLALSARPPEPSA